MQCVVVVAATQLEEEGSGPEVSAELCGQGFFFHKLAEVAARN